MLLPRAQAQVGDPQDYDFWNKMRQHNLVLWFDYTEEATSYQTLDMSMWGAVKYRRTLTAEFCNIVQSVAIDHKKSPSTYQTSIPIHSDKGFFTEFWYDPQPLAIVIAPVSFVMLSYMDEWALNATRKNRTRKEATLKELKVYARLFVEAKSADVKSLMSASSSPRTSSRADGYWTVKRDRDGKVSKVQGSLGLARLPRPTKRCSTDR